MYTNQKFILNIGENTVGVASVSDGSILIFEKKDIEDLVELLIAASLDIKVNKGGQNV